MWFIALVVVLLLLAVVALRRFGPMRNTEQLRRTDPEAAARAEQRLAEHQQYTQQARGGNAGGF